MNFGITFRNIKGNGEIINYIDHRLSFAFTRTHHEIEDVRITLSDINGPRGGIDKQCQIVLIPSALQPIVVSEKQEDLRQAIDRCLYRASQCLDRKLKRKRALLKKPQQAITLSGTASAS